MASGFIQNPSIVEWFAEHEGYRCGYCKQEDSNYSHGMWAHSLAVQDYQDLIDRGWRRSGKYCYKPTMHLTCCPHYTIRCEAWNFKLSKSQKKVIKRVNRYLITGDKPGESTREINPKESAKNESETSQQATTSKSTKNPPEKGTGPDPNKPPCKKAKELRKERKLQKLAARGGNQTEPESTKNNQKSNEPKALEDFLDEPFKVENPAHKLEIRLVRTSPPTPASKTSQAGSYEVFRQYQMTVHKEGPDECTQKGFQQFLVASPLQPVMDDTLKDGYGSFHQQYILDGKIIAVGVVDILPYCLSSVYLYYDPQFEFLSLGTYTALQELAFTRSLTKQQPELKYYYMGYYIHTCPKMKYKGQYYPSFLLCPETYLWKPIEQCSPKLDQSNYARLEENKDKGDQNGVSNIDKVLILHKSSAMTYGNYRRAKKSVDSEEVKEYAGLVGRKCAERMLLFRK